MQSTVGIARREKFFHMSAIFGIGYCEFSTGKIISGLWKNSVEIYRFAALQPGLYRGTIRVCSGLTSS